MLGILNGNIIKIRIWVIHLFTGICMLVTPFHLISNQRFRKYKQFISLKFGE